MDVIFTCVQLLPLWTEALSSLGRDASSLLDPMECTDMAEEQRVHSPPASLVPRIHVVLAQKLQHINPLLPACLNKEESKTCKCKCWCLVTQTLTRHAGVAFCEAVSQMLSHQDKFLQQSPSLCPFSFVLILFIKMSPPHPTPPPQKIHPSSCLGSWRHTRASIWSPCWLSADVQSFVHSYFLARET